MEVRSGQRLSVVVSLESGALACGKGRYVKTGGALVQIWYNLLPVFSFIHVWKLP